MALIDSLMLNYYVPPIIFRTIPGSHDSNDKMICIDGKQRLTSIKRFLDGEIYHRDNMTGIRYWSPRLQRDHRNSRDKTLPHNIYSQFLRKQIVCVEYRELNEQQEREIFNRVQMGMPLSAAEKMSAILSDRALFVRNLQKKLTDWPAKVKMAEDRNRMFQSVGHIVRAVESYPKLTSITNVSLDKWLREPGEIQHPTGLEQDIDLLITLAQEYSEVAFPTSIAVKLAPIEFIFSALIVDRFKSALDLSQLARAISDTRREIRDQHEDIRSNNRVVASFQQYISGELERRVKTGVYSKAGLTTPLVKRKRSVAQVDDGEPADMDLDSAAQPASRKKRVNFGHGESIVAPLTRLTPEISRPVITPSLIPVGGSSGVRTVAPMKPFNAQGSSEASKRSNHGWGSDGLNSPR